MFLHLSVILYPGGESGRPSIPGADTTQSRHPPEQTPSWEQTLPGADTPGSRHPPTQCVPGYTGNKRAVHILLECILVVEKKFPLHYQDSTRRYCLLHLGLKNPRLSSI